MSNDTRIGLMKVGGWLMLAGGALIIVADFVGSEHTFRDFRNALKEGLFFLMVGAFFLAQVGYTKRIRQLEKEKAALRAAKSEVGPSQGKAQP
jgi:hypothetical protein